MHAVATHFNAGNRSMVATYLGSSDFKRSASEKKTITIDTATTTTSLELSAGQVSYRDEQVEQLSVSCLSAVPGHYSDWDRHGQWRELSDKAVLGQGLVHAAGPLLQDCSPT